MSKIKMLTGALMIAFMAVAVNVNAQAQADTKKAKEGAKEVSKFEAGKTLSKDDIGFLDLVANSDKGKSRGKGEVKDVTIDKSTFHEGHKLTADEAALISKKVASYRGANKLDEAKEGSKSRGSTCYYYCYYNAYGDYVCYWYCY